MERAAGMVGNREERVAVGVCQIRQGYDFRDNMRRAAELVRSAARNGARICVLPEMFLTPYEPAAIRQAAAFSPGALELMKEAAEGEGVYVVAGSVPWRAPHGGKFFNRCHVLDPLGRVIHVHDKLHLFDCNPPGGPSVKESETIEAGDRLGHFPTPWGNAAVVICYDIRFPQLVQILADSDVRLLFVPSAFSQATGRAHWEMLVRMRALELQAYVAGVQPAFNPGLAYVPWGRSVVASAWGDVVARLGEDEDARVVDLDMTLVDDIRSRFPLLAHRRTDIYETRWKGPS